MSSQFTIILKRKARGSHSFHSTVVDTRTQQRWQLTVTTACETSSSYIIFSSRCWLVLSIEAFVPTMLHIKSTTASNTTTTASFTYKVLHSGGGGGGVGSFREKLRKELQESNDAMEAKMKWTTGPSDSCLVGMFCGSSYSRSCLWERIVWTTKSQRIELLVRIVIVARFLHLPGIFTPP